MPSLTEAQRRDIDTEIWEARKSHERRMIGIDTSFIDEIYKLKAKLALMQSLASDSMGTSELLYLALEHISIAKEMLHDVAGIEQTNKMKEHVDAIEMESALIFETLYG